MALSLATLELGRSFSKFMYHNALFLLFVLQDDICSFMPHVTPYFLIEHRYLHLELFAEMSD
jgi:hypothetical protein